MNIFLQNESVKVVALITGATIRAVVIIEMEKVFNIFFLTGMEDVEYERDEG